MVGGKAWPGYLNAGQTHVPHTRAENTARGKSGQFCSVHLIIHVVNVGRGEVFGLTVILESEEFVSGSRCTCFFICADTCVLVYNTNVYMYVCTICV